jgi:hypothetical protein
MDGNWVGGDSRWRDMHTLEGYMEVNSYTKVPIRFGSIL